MAPAKTVLPMVTNSLPDHLKSIQFGQIEGSIWSPRMSSLSYKNIHLNNLRADISPLKLLLAEVDADISVDDPSLKLEGKLLASKSSIKTGSLSIDIKADRLNPFMQFPVKGLRGTMTGLIEQAAFDANGQWQQINGRGSWQQASIDYLEQSLDLGDFDFEINTSNENNLIVSIIDNQGVLDLKGQFVLEPSKTYQLDVSTQQQLPEHLERWISRLGKLENNRYRIKWSGQLK